MVKHRPWTVVGTAVGAAVLCVLVMRVGRQLRHVDSVGVSSEISALVEAVSQEATRPFEGRLARGFAYKPALPATRGALERKASTSVRLAALRLELALSRAYSASAPRREMGLVHAVVGDLDRAADVLEAVTEEHARDHEAQTNLAAVYVARARDLDHAEDWPKALAAAERAIKAEPSRPEAYFNRALALEGLNLLGDAEDAWSKVVSLEPSSPWAREADAHRGRLARRPRTLDVADNSVSDRQVLRERIEDGLLPRWGRAVLAGEDTESAAALHEAVRLSGELAALGGDSMAHDATTAIEAARARRDVAVMRALARGHAAYGRARQQFLDDRLVDASKTMTAAAAVFEEGGSAYRLWAPVYAAIAARMAASPNAALTLTTSVSEQDLPRTYYNLRGRLAWTAGAAYASLGQYDLARARHRIAAQLYEDAGEWENSSVNHTGVAEAAWFLGDRREAWTRQIASVRYLDRLRMTTRRNVTLFMGAYFSLGEGLPEAALCFQDALVRDVDRADFAFGRPSAHMQRARILATLGATDAALADVGIAEGARLALNDPGVRERSGALIRATRAEVLKQTQPEQALRDIDQAIAYFHRGRFGAQLARLFLLKAGILERLGDTRAAASSLEQSIDAFERDRSGLGSTATRMQAFEDERGAFRELLRFEANVRQDLPQALRTAERGRARLPSDPQAGKRTRIDPMVDYRRLPGDVAAIYYATLEDRVLGWVLTSDGYTEFSAAVSVKTLRGTVERIHRLIQDGGAFGPVAAASRPLANLVLAPAIRLAGGRRTLVIIPDGALTGLPFAAMPDEDGQPLVRRFRIAVAPSLTTFFWSSARLARFSPDSVLAVGDGHDAVVTRVPHLPLADDEALEVAHMYPRSTVLAGRAATRERFLAVERDVVHFAGHTMVNPRFPLTARMLLAPDPGRGDNGMLIASEIANHRFTRTGVVVLATCDSAVGRVIEGEGMLSVAGAFLAAGVPSVVATLWPIDDDARPLLMAFHQGLRKRRDAAAAVRAAQLDLLDARGMDIPVRVWGAFVALGGVMDDRSF